MQLNVSCKCEQAREGEVCSVSRELEFHTIYFKCCGENVAKIQTKAKFIAFEESETTCNEDVGFMEILWIRTWKRVINQWRHLTED